jgi:hypothetical protein
MLSVMNLFNTFIFLWQMWEKPTHRDWPIDTKPWHSCKTGVVYIYIRSHLTSFPFIVKYSLVIFIITLHHVSTFMKTLHRHTYLLANKIIKCPCYEYFRSFCHHPSTLIRSTFWRTYPINDFLTSSRWHHVYMVHRHITHNSSTSDIILLHLRCSSYQPMTTSTLIRIFFR